MFDYEVQGIVVTSQTVQLHGCWNFGQTKRFEILRLPISHFLSGSVLEALQAAALERARHVDEEWEQFLLWG